MPYPLRVAIVGHSFVKRAQDHIVSADVQFLQLSHTIQFFSHSGCHVHHLDNFIEALSSFSPHLVILDVGTNDLCSQEVSPLLLFQRVNTFSQRLTVDLGVKLVVVLQVLHRTPTGYFGMPSSFNHKVDSYNDLLTSTVKLYRQQNLPLDYWFQKGIRTNITKFIKDGVHLNADGIQLYLRNLRRAILNFAPLCL